MGREILAAKETRREDNKFKTPKPELNKEKINEHQMTLGICRGKA